MPVIAITGTSTEVGKTIVTAALAAVIRGWDSEVIICKPVQTGLHAGEEGDAHLAARLAGVPGVELVRYPEPLSPLIAARRSSQPLWSAEKLAAAVLAVGERDNGAQDGVILIEGAGGILVRLGENNATLIDIALLTHAPLVVVCEAGLGALNHAELTVRAAQAAGLSVSGLVVGSWPTTPEVVHHTNIESFAEHTDVPVLGKIPEGVSALAPKEFQMRAPTWFDTALSSMLWHTR